jgi:Periplasmic copper-binding protein (NosD)
MKPKSKPLNRLTRSPGLPAKRRSEVPSFIKRNIVFKILSACLNLLPLASTNAWETASGVAGTAIVSVPFIISVPGRYFLASNLTYVPTNGAAITINADEVILDLNGTSLHGPGGSNSAIGVLVPSRHNVTIQNGDIDGFGLAGIELLANSAQNIVDNVRLNANQIGVLADTGTLNIVKNCVIDGGTVGILFASGSGNRASNNTLGNQGPPTGIALLTVRDSRNYFENNLVSRGFSASGQVMAGGIHDKYRFETFVGFPILHPVSGGVEELASSL